MLKRQKGRTICKYVVVHTGITIERVDPVNVAILCPKALDSVVERVALRLGKRAPLDVGNWVGTSRTLFSGSGRDGGCERDERSREGLDAQIHRE